MLGRQPDTVLGLTRDIMRQTGVPYDQALETAARMLKPAGYAADVRADTALSVARAKAVEKAQGTPAGTMLALTDPSSPKYPALKAKFDAEVQRQLDLLSPGSTRQGTAGNAPPAQGVNSGQWGDLRVKQ
jgi:hypothetical protein